ncbi:MAG: hypothetical protein RI965_1989 [Bacteroidota bacterium]|jgi:Protein of unknown function (DUF4199)|nr:DUF4199 domain-containing protein [Chitinophagia bacterium]
MEKISTLHNKETLQYGLFSAGAAVLIFVVLYILGAEYFMSPVAWISSYLFPVLFAVLGALQVKKKNNGYLDFKEALKITFGVFVITGLISTIVSHFIFNVFDVAFAERMKQLTIEKAQETMQKFNVPESEMEKAVDKLTEQDMFSFSALSKSFAYACIMYFIEALIVSAIIKKKKPEVEF